jgi:hypothetical protein
VVLEVLDDANKLDETECWWIAFGRACGWPLTNLTDGGGSLSEDVRTERRRRQAECQAEQRAQAEAKRHAREKKKQQRKEEYETAAAEQQRYLDSLIYSPQQLAIRKQIKEEQRCPQRSPGEIAARCFELFEKHFGSRMF